jgi:hypothetical protein
MLTSGVVYLLIKWRFIVTLDAFDYAIVKQIFKQICKDYANHVTHEATTFKGKASNFISATFGYSDSNETRKNNKELDKRIDSIQNADDLIELALFCRKTAYKVQSNTLLRNSTFAETCHLIAQFAIRLPEVAKYEQKINPLIKINDKILSELPKKLADKIRETHQKLEDKKAENKKRVRNKEKVDMEVCYEYMRELYYLGDYHLDHDPDYIKRVFPVSHFRWKQSDDCKLEINENYPIIIQPNFAEIQIKRFRPDLDNQILNEYMRTAIALAAIPETSSPSSHALATPTTAAAAANADTILLTPHTAPTTAVATMDSKSPTAKSSSSEVMRSLTLNPSPRGSSVTKDSTPIPTSIPKKKTKRKPNAIMPAKTVTDEPREESQPPSPN